jgi:hypothetical protein
MPSLGGDDNDEKFKGIYEQTLSYYSALFKNERPNQIWEPTIIRFSEETFNCASVSLQRLASLSLFSELLPLFTAIKKPLSSLRSKYMRKAT